LRAIVSTKSGGRIDLRGSDRQIALRCKRRCEFVRGRRPVGGGSRCQETQIARGRHLGVAIYGADLIANINQRARHRQPLGQRVGRQHVGNDLIIKAVVLILAGIEGRIILIRLTVEEDIRRIQGYPAAGDRVDERSLLQRQAARHRERDVAVEGDRAARP
jgi:hypothetical protein